MNVEAGVLTFAGEQRPSTRWQPRAASLRLRGVTLLLLLDLATIMVGLSFGALAREC